MYAVGRPELTRRGRWMAAVLSGGPGALLSHWSAAAIRGIEDREPCIAIALPYPRKSRRRDLCVHCLKLEPEDRDVVDGIPATSIVRTMIDIAAAIPESRLEAAVNAADRLDLIDPERLREEIRDRRRIQGLPALRRVLDRQTFRLTDSELERMFLRLVRPAGLEPPETGTLLNGFKVDFFFPELGLVVETDGLRYHRTAASQERDRRRDQAHAAAGLTTLRFTHGQVAHEPDAVLATLSKVAARLCSERRFRS